MGVNQTKKFEEGRDYWFQYLRINGHSFSPDEKGLCKLSRNLDINAKHLRICINTFLATRSVAKPEFF